MKGLNKLVLASTIAAISAGAQAELKALDDSAMGELTGQAGLTIDIETKWSIGEFAYHDAGVVVLKDLAMGANSNEANDAFHTNSTLLDNIRLTLDVAGAGAAIGGDAFANYGFSEVKNLAAVHASAASTAGVTLDAGLAAAAGGSAAVNPANAMSSLSVDIDTGLTIDDERIYGDGDLVLHFGFTDAWQKGGGFAAYANGAGSDGLGGVTDLANATYAAAKGVATRAVDFQFDIGAIALADSTYADTTGTRLGNETIQKGTYDAATVNADGTTGAMTAVAGLDTDTGGATTTTLISNLSMKGYLGPMDIVIENNGNGFGQDGSYIGANLGAPNNGSGNADSKIHWDSFFKVTDLDLYIDIAGVYLGDIQIHNERGDLGSLNVDVNGDFTSSFGFAHSKRDIYAVRDAVLQLAQGGYVDGIAINTEFKGDIDIGHLSFGDTGVSIGAIYMTDVESTTNWTISAH
jgi:hypothetical protein